ncbi:MAG: ferredoxin family protein [Dehalococcoidia bacterium]|nr:ferredoxin family protein [Dehalococcoidia bacterium]
MAKGYIEIDREMCKGCRICIAFCPQSSISLSDQMNSNSYLPAQLNESHQCTGCAICATVCPDIAIEVYRD